MKQIALMIVVLTLASGGAAAQTRPAAGRPGPVLPARVYVSVDGLFQTGSNDFRDSLTFRENAENARLDTDYAVGSGPAFDVAGGVVIWRTLAAGVGVTRFARTTTTAVTASVPHPFFFNQPRSVSGEVGGAREELAVHVQVRGVFPLSRRIQVALFGGPSFFTVTQSVVDDVDYAESYPFDTATFSRATLSRQSVSKVGVNVGGDVAYFFAPRVGVGVSVQYSGATVQMTLPGGSADVKAGGGQVGGGLRLRF